MEAVWARSAIVQMRKLGVSSRRDATVATVGNRDQRFRDKVIFEKCQTDLFLATSNCFCSRRFNESTNTD